MKRGNLITILIILVIVALVIFSKIDFSEKVDENVLKCIGENAILYTQLGCHACETQEEMFGNNLDLINVVDCFYERDKCDGIEYTPTWKIKGEYHVGVQSIEELKGLTNCDD